MSLETILFDCDGVLVDSRATAEDAWTRWARHYGLDPAAVLDGLHGRRSRETVARHLPAERREEGVALIDALELETAHLTTEIPGARALLESLSPTRWAVVTSAPRSLVLGRLAGAGLPAPRVLVASEDVAAGKPAPDCYLLGAARLGSPISACIVVEDSPNGIAAGRTAGAGLVVAVGDDPSGAAVVVPDLTDTGWWTPGR